VTDILAIRRREARADFEATHRVPLIAAGLILILLAICIISEALASRPGEIASIPADRPRNGFCSGPFLPSAPHRRSVEFATAEEANSFPICADANPCGSLAGRAARR